MQQIKLVILDCDGVLTDGKLIYNDEGIESKNFSAQDGLGIKLLQQSDIEIAVVTGKKSNILKRRCEVLKIKYLYQNIHNKVKVSRKLLNKLNLSWSNLAYMGDDWNDYPVIKKAAFSAAPANANPDFRKKVDLVTKSKGGNGAVREFIVYILKKQNKYEKTLAKFINKLENS